jgi:AsmA protein
MKLLLKIVGGILALLLFLVLGLNFLLSADAVRERVAERVREQSGRELKVNGSTSVLFLPKPHIVLTDVEFSDPGHPAAPDLSVARLSLDVSFGQLLSKNVDAERVVMERPVLTVHVPPKSGEEEKHGRLQSPSHDLASAAPRFIPAQADGTAKPKREIRLNDVRIEDGTIRLLYGKEGDERRIEKLNAALSLPRLADPLTAKGDFDWKGARVGFDLKLATPADLKAERSARIDLKLDAEAISTAFAGNVFSRPAFKGEGDLIAKSRSIPSVIAWLRREPATLTAVGDGEVASHIAWHEGEVSVTQARFALSHATGQGQAVLDLTGAKPHLRAALLVDSLDLTPFLASEGRTSSPAQPLPAGAPEEPATVVPQTESRDWFTKPKGTEAPVDAEQQPSSETRPPAAIGTTTGSVSSPVLPAGFDADVNVNLAETKYEGLAMGPSTLSVKLRDGVLEADLGSMKLYEGQGSGKLTIDGAKPVPTFSVNLILEGVSAQPLLAAAGGFNLISGLADLELELKGEGGSAADMKHSISGTGSLDIAEGAIEGINLTEMIAGLGAGNIPDVNQGPGAKTTFADFGASFRMASGVAETHDLEITSPLLKVKARGTVDFVTGTVDFLTHPKIVSGPQGRGGANDLAGLTIPVRIEGPFEKPAFKPEIGGMFANPNEAGRTVNQIGEILQKKLKGKPVGEAIGRFLGSVRIGTEQQNSEEESGRPGEAPPSAEGSPPAQEEGSPPAQEEELNDPEMEDILR